MGLGRRGPLLRAKGAVGEPRALALSARRATRPPAPGGAIAVAVTTCELPKGAMKVQVLMLAAIAAAATASLPVVDVGGVPHTPVPGVGLLPSSCVNEVPSGTSSRRAPGGGLEATLPDGTVRTFPSCGGVLPVRPGAAAFNRTTGRRSGLLGAVPGAGSAASNDKKDGLPADYNGWLAYTVSKATGAAYDAFLGSFSTPDAPKEVPQILYLFTGLQNINWIPKADPDPTVDFDIIQPVTQYPGNFGNYWSARSWYVTLRDGALASTEIRLEEGDNVFGNMTRTGTQSFTVVSVNSRTGEQTVQKASNARLSTQPWAYNTLECYGCSGCGTFPTKPSVFSGLKLFAGGSEVKATWDVTPVKPVQPLCKAKAVVKDSADVTFDFQ